MTRQETVIKITKITRIVGELLTNAENQYIKHIMNQYMYKQTIK